MKQIRYRKASYTDADAIAELHAESWRAHYRGEYDDSYLNGPVFKDRQQIWDERLKAPKQNQHVIAADSDGRVIGFACVYGNEDSKWGSFLDNIHVLPGHQSLGIGTEIMKRVFKWCQKNYPDSGLYLWVLDSNKRGQRFYSSLGALDRGGELSEPAGGGEIHGRRYVWKRLPQVT